MPQNRKKIRVNGEYIPYTIIDGHRIRVKIADGAYGTPKTGNKFKYISASTETDLAAKVKSYFDSLYLKKEEKILFKTAIQNWLQLYFLNEVELSTYNRTERIIRCQILPAFGAIPHKYINEITPDDVQKALSTIKANYSDSTYSKAYYYSKLFFDYEVDIGTIPKSPFIKQIQRDRKRKNKTKNEHKLRDTEHDIMYLTDDEIDRIKAVIYNGYDTEIKRKKNGSYVQHIMPYQGEYFVFMLNTGLRAGEACGLMYSDYNPQNKTITIHNNITYTTDRDNHGKTTGYVKKISAPKTDDSVDTIRINDKACDILNRMRQEEPEGYTGFIIHPEGQTVSISPNTLYNRFRRICQYAGVDPRGLHVLRHTFASRLFALTNGNSLIVSRALRHSSVSFTEDIYIDLVQQYQEKIFSNLEI